MITINFKNEKIRVNGVTFESKFGTVKEYTEKNVIVELTNNDENSEMFGTKFTRAFSKKTGKAFGYNHLTILP